MNTAGKIIRSKGKVIYSFGTAEVPVHPGQEFGYTDIYHIGVNLDSSKIDDINDNFPVEVHLHELTEEQQKTLAVYVPLYLPLRKNIATVSAKARSGKDYLATTVAGYCDDVSLIALGDAIRDVRNILYGEPPKGVKDRPPLIKIGQGLRKEDPNIWIKVWLDRVIKKSMMRYTRKFICPDVRQPNEFSFFKSMGVLTVKIAADEEKRLAKIRELDGEEALNTELLTDDTESHAGGFNADITIHNDYDVKFVEDVAELVIPVLVERGW